MRAKVHCCRFGAQLLVHSSSEDDLTAGAFKCSSLFSQNHFRVDL